MLEETEGFVESIMGYYGQGLVVYNWHQNGEGEPWDNFFDNNMNGNELDLIRSALGKREEETQ